MNETIKIWMHMNEYQSRDDNPRLKSSLNLTLSRGREDIENGFMDAYLKKENHFEKETAHGDF